MTLALKDTVNHHGPCRVVAINRVAGRCLLLRASGHCDWVAIGEVVW